MATAIQERGGNLYDKYTTQNPIARSLMNGFLAAFDELTPSGAESAYEVGCGEGNLSIRLARKIRRVSGSDISERVVAEANRNADQSGVAATFSVRSIYDLASEREIADLVVCCEVLEHLEHSERALDILANLTRRHLLLSVPREPIWRVLNMARGAYIGQLGNTPGHIQHWSSRSFRKMVSRKLDIVETRHPLPWTMVLCRRRG